MNLKKILALIGLVGSAGLVIVSTITMFSHYFSSGQHGTIILGNSAIQLLGIIGVVLSILTLVGKGKFQIFFVVGGAGLLVVQIFFMVMGLQASSVIYEYGNSYYYKEPTNIANPYYLEGIDIALLVITFILSIVSFVFGVVSSKKRSKGVSMVGLITFVALQLFVIIADRNAISILSIIFWTLTLPTYVGILLGSDYEAVSSERAPREKKIAAPIAPKAQATVEVSKAVATGYRNIWEEHGYRFSDRP